MSAERESLTWISSSSTTSSTLRWASAASVMASSRRSRSRENVESSASGPTSSTAADSATTWALRLPNARCRTRPGEPMPIFGRCVMIPLYH